MYHRSLMVVSRGMCRPWRRTPPSTIPLHACIPANVCTSALWLILAHHPASIRLGVAVDVCQPPCTSVKESISVLIVAYVMMVSVYMQPLYASQCCFIIMQVGQLLYVVGSCRRGYGRKILLLRRSIRRFLL